VATAISVNGLTKRYGDHTAVDGVSFSIAVGETFGILGPNGAGKTTTLEMIEGLRKPDAGEVFVLDQPVWPDPRAIQARIGVQLQNTNLFEALSARELLTLFASFYEKPEPDQLADRALARVGLEAKAAGEVVTLSGGQKQRLAIALALVHEPEVVFLDEPTTGLDPQARARMWDEVRKLQSAGTTVFLTTHYLEEADALADRLAIIDHGTIVASGTADELKSEIAGDVITLGVAGLNERVLDLVHALPYVREATIDGEVVRLYVDKGEAAVPQLLRTLDGAGLAPQTITLARPSLDDVFLRQTGRSLREEAKPAA
jgi:ABC-2 type transport system ATP-binding protein